MKSKKHFFIFLMSLFLLLGLQTGAASAAVELPDGGELSSETYYVNKDMTVTNPFIVNGTNPTIVFKGPYSVKSKLNKEDSLFSVSNAAKLSIYIDSELTEGTLAYFINNSDVCPSEGGFAYIDANSTLEICSLSVQKYITKLKKDDNTSTKNEVSGGAVCNLGTLKITGCVFSECKALNMTTFGGALSNYGRSVIADSTFAKCEAAGTSNFGGAIFNQGILEVKNSKFTDCKADTGSNKGISYGGAIYNREIMDSAKCILEKSIFKDCEATATSCACGGAVASNSCSVEMKGGKIIECNAKAKESYGGAMYLSKGTHSITEIEISKCKVINIADVNSTNVGAYGGGAFINANLDMKKSSIGECTAEGDENAYGGAICLAGNNNKVEMTDSTISGCTANIIAAAGKTASSGRAGGGAVYSLYATHFTMTGGSISGCKAMGDRGYDVSGGAVYSNAGSVTITGAKIEKCEANDEGGNSAYGGAIHSDSLYAKLILDNCTISDCKAVETGYGSASAGAVSNDRGYMRINECKITDSSAQAGKEARGGVLFNTGIMEMKNTEISRCSALGFGNGGIGYGGAIYNSLNSTDDYYVMDGGSITCCIADYGGGIANAAGDITISGSITGCTATVTGGGYYQIPSDYDASLVIAGEANIAGNTSKEKDSNVESHDPLKLFKEPVLVAGSDESEEFMIAFESLSEKADIGVTMTSDGQIILNADETKKSDAATLLSVFNSDSPDSAVRYEADSTLRLGEKAPADIAAAPKTIDSTYTGGVLPLVTEGTSEEGELVYRLAEEEQYSSEIPVGTDAGIYRIYYGIIGDKNHIDNYGFEPLDAIIRPAEVDCDELKGKQDLVYTADAQELLTVNASGVTFAFRLKGDEEYTADIPKGIDAGTYFVEWIVDEAIPNYVHNGEVFGTLTAIIKKAEQAAPEICDIGFKEDSKGSYIAYIEEVENGLYSFDGMKTFSTNNQLAGVAPGEKVTGYVKYAGDENHFESPAVKGSATAPKSDLIPVSGPDDEDESSSSGYTPEYPLYIEPGGTNGGGESGTAKNDRDEEAEGPAEATENENETDDSINIMLTIDSNIAIVNEKETELDVPAVIMNGRMMLPIRFIAENLGADVQWLKDTRTVVITMDDTVIVLTIDSNIATVNGEAIELDAPAVIMNERTILPIRFVAENLGANVEWDGEAGTVMITK